MITTYQIAIPNILLGTDVKQDCENFHQSFKSNIPARYGYVSVAVINSSATLLFSKNISVDGQVNPILIKIIEDIISSYATASFETLKNQYIEAIDQKTRELISRGAEFDGHMFSLSDNAQRNWIATKASIDVYNALSFWPVPITTLDDNIYLLKNAGHIISFTTTMLFGVAKHYNSGRALKILVKECKTKGELLAIKDKR